MSLDELTEEVEEAYASLDDEIAVELDRETKHELAMLQAALGQDDVDELTRRAIHLLFQSTVDTGKLDFRLRGDYDVTYDEYLSGMTYEEMTAGSGFSAGASDEQRRYLG